MSLPGRRLRGRRIAVLVADGFEMAEYAIPVGALKLAGASITVISLRRGRIRGVNLHEPSSKIRAHLGVEEAKAADFDGLYIPGGLINPDLLRQSARARMLVAEFEGARKPISALCHAPWLLASAGLIKGRTVTSWPGIRDDMVNAGATWLDQSVVRDGNWLTSRGPQDLADYVPALIGFFAETEPVLATRPARRGVPSAPQRSEPPALMIRAIQALPRPSLRGFALGLIVGGLAVARLRAIGPSIGGISRQLEEAA